MKTKDQFIAEANSLLKKMERIHKGCFLLECDKCGEGTFLFEGIYDVLYKKYEAGCPFCHSELTLKIGYSELN